MTFATSSVLDSGTMQTVHSFYVKFLTMNSDRQVYTLWTQQSTDVTILSNFMYSSLKRKVFIPNRIVLTNRLGAVHKRARVQAIRHTYPDLWSGGNCDPGGKGKEDF